MGQHKKLKVSIHYYPKHRGMGFRKRFFIETGGLDLICNLFFLSLRDY